jgi:hypothetical protein
MKLAVAVGTMTTKMFLAVVFFIFLTPIAICYRLFHGDFMKLKPNHTSGGTYWSQRNHPYKPEDLEKMW